MERIILDYTIYTIYTILYYTILYTYIDIWSCCRDHLDLVNLAKMPDKSIPVVVPQLRYSLLRQELTKLGFTNLVQAKTRIGETELTTFVSETTNREMEDSMLLIDDGATSLLNANDCKLEAHIQDELVKRYPNGIDIYTGQYSGAAWHPMCYAGSEGFSEARVAELCKKHAHKTLHRFISACKVRLVYLHHITCIYQVLRARKCIPGSGPAAFLSPDLFKYNYISHSASSGNSIFPDAYQIGFEDAWEQAGEGSLLCRCPPTPCRTCN